MVVGGGRESHTREKGVPFAGGQISCAWTLPWYMRGAESLLFVRLTRTKQQKANLFEPVPVSSFRLVTAIQTNAEIEVSANINQPVLDLVRLRPTTLAPLPPFLAPNQLSKTDQLSQNVHLSVTIYRH